jgi:hypothetical protein
MPEFVNPFSGKVPDRKLTHEELIRAIRLNLAADEDRWLAEGRKEVDEMATEMAASGQ